MKKLFVSGLFVVFACCLVQAQIGRVGINTTAPSAVLHVKDSSVLFSGVTPLPATPGMPPASGPGIRMMWYADKGAFRVGQVSGTQWNKDSIGTFSFAAGINNIVKGSASASFGNGNYVTGGNSLSIGIGNVILGSGSMTLGLDTYATGGGSMAAGYQSGASGTGSIVAGWYSSVSGDYSLAFGSQSMVSGNHSIGGGSSTSVSGNNSFGVGQSVSVTGDYACALGLLSNASGEGSFGGGYFGLAPGDYAFAFGTNATASGTSSFATGNYSESNSYASFSGGQCNELLAGNPSSWIATDPLFVLGNGLDPNNRKNALTILKNAKVGINTSSPDALLHVVRDVPTNGPYFSTAAAIFEGDQGSFIQLSNDNTIQGGILSGNEATSIRSALIFAADSSVLLRSGGNTSRAVISKTGQMGIGDLTPNAKLHVSDGTGGSLYNSNAEMIIEDNDASYLQFSNPTAEEAGILSGNSAASLRSAIIFRADSSVQVRAGGGTTRLAVTKTGNIGINTLSPQRLLHVANGSSGANSHSSSVAVLESSGDASLSLLTPSAEESAVYFGNPANTVHGGIIYNSTVANGFAFRTNGNTTRMVLDDIGNVGVGENTPNARMHISNGASNGVYNSNAGLIVEDNSTAFIQLSTPAANESGLISGTDLLGIRSGIIFRADSAVHFRTGGNTTRMYILKNGDIGIGIATPTSRLHVSGNGNFTGTVTASCGVLSCSDQRYKKNITAMSGTLDLVLSLEPVYYDWDREHHPEKEFTAARQIGVIAQELEQYFPELVHTDDDGYKTVDYSRLSVVLLQAIKEQAEQIAILKEEMAALRER